MQKDFHLYSKEVPVPHCRKNAVHFSCKDVGRGGAHQVTEKIKDMQSERMN